MLKVLFIGLGSIGRRHLKIIRELIDILPMRFVSGQGDLSYQSDNIDEIKEFVSLDEAIDAEPDFAIISNPTSFHAKTALKLAKAGIPLFIEKPLSNNLDMLDDIKTLVTEKKLPLMVGFQMRHHPGYKQLYEIVTSGKIGRPLALRGCIGQYLPDWRPGTDYRRNYSARKDLGGGVILDLSHEIDIALSIMGPAHKVCCMCGTYSELEIDTEDVANLIIEHKNNGLSSLHLNCVERGYEWSTSVIGSEGTAIWDYGKGHTLLKEPNGHVAHFSDQSGFDRDDLFRTQMKAWLDVFLGKVPPPVGITEGIAVTKLCLAAMQSSLESRYLPL